MSAGMAVSAGGRPSSALASSSRSRDRPAITTLAPSARQRRATARPIPELPPMTTTVSALLTGVLLEFAQQVLEQRSQRRPLVAGQGGDHGRLARHARGHDPVGDLLASRGQADQVAAAVVLACRPL